MENDTRCSGHLLASGSQRTSIDDAVLRLLWEEKIEFEGEVVEALRSGMFRIKLDNDRETLGYTAGRMRRYRIRIFPGDRVKVELSPYDLSRGRIVFRFQ